MAIKSGRVGVRHDQVDHYGRIKNVAGGIFSNVSTGSLVSSASAENSKLNTPSSFTGKIDLTSIKGNTIKWNQLINTVVSKTTDGITTSFDSSKGLFSIRNDSRTTNLSSGLNSNTLVAHADCVAGHKYLINTDKVINGITIHTGSEQTYMPAILTYNGNGGFYIRLTSTYDFVSEHPIGDVTSFHIYIVDLTYMFGAGNEPTTVEQFKSMFPLDYYEYDTGSLLSFKATALQNAFTGEEIYLPTLKYFPNGMDGVGSDYDELTEIKAYHRMARVDLGTLNWTYNSSYGFISGGLSGQIKGESTGNANGNIMCSKYTTSPYNTVTGGQTDKCIGVSSTDYGYIVISDSAYTDAQAFKASLSGIILVYPLVNPTETDIDVDFNLSLNVNEGENLQLLPVGTDTPATAPLRATVTSYKSGATGNDVEKLLGSIAQVETSPATGNHAVGDYIMYNYQLYKVTASITTGGSLVVGTNITATTVMDEFKTL